jgi:predicted DNA-binding transcriptional regulator YafY
VERRGVIDQSTGGQASADGGEPAAGGQRALTCRPLKHNLVERRDVVPLDDAAQDIVSANNFEQASGEVEELATACRRGERARLSYRDLRGRATVRDVDPYRLVHTGHRWYFVARDVAKGEWRTFRADRVAQVTSTGQAVEIVDPPDPALLVSQGLTKGVYAQYMTIRLPLPMDQALRLVPPTIGAHRPDGPNATIAEIGGPDADSLAQYLLGLGVPLQVLSPDDVRQALLRRTRELFEGNGGRQP